MPSFTPKTPEVSPQSVPYFEDSAALGIIGSDLRKDLPYYMSKVTTLLGRLDGVGVRFEEGVYGDGGTARHGYRITFTAYAMPAVIHCAALPIRNETPRKRERALAQALYILVHKLQGAVNAYIFEPDSLPLVPHLLGSGGKTVMEAVRYGLSSNLLTKGE